MQHGDLHNIRCRALNGRVDSFALFAVLHLNVLFALQSREITPASKQGFDIALFRRQLADSIQIFFDTGELCEIGFDKIIGLSQRQFGGTRQPECGHAVDQSEVDRLGMATHVLVHLFKRNIIDCRGSRSMDILSCAEGIEHGLILRHVRYDAKFDLRVINGKQNVALCRDKSIANAAAFFGADGNVLQIWIRRRQTSGHRAGLAVGGMHASGL